jgi:hypothetical protein
MALDDQGFDRWCDRLMCQEVEPVIGLLQRMQGLSPARVGFGLDHRVESLRRAEEVLVDQLDRVGLIERLLAKCMTKHMCDYWLTRRPHEVPTVNGYPVWLAATLIDVVDCTG